MEVTFAIADGGRDRSAGVYRDGDHIRWRVVQTSQRGTDCAWSLVYWVGCVFECAELFSFTCPLSPFIAPSLRRRLARAGFVHTAVY